MAALDAVFKDENGKSITLETIFDKPIILLSVYFMCTSICNFLQADLANALNVVDQISGKDFNVITLSFADDEDHTHANTSKKNYSNPLTREFPLEYWFNLSVKKRQGGKKTKLSHDTYGGQTANSRKNLTVCEASMEVVKSFFETPAPARDKGIWSWLITTDHKRVGLMCLFSILFWFLLAVLLGGIIRLGLMFPGETIMGAQMYNSLFTWPLFATSWVQLLATPVISITLLLVMIERYIGIGLFDPSRGGDPILYKHLFWMYSHPVPTEQKSDPIGYQREFSFGNSLDCASLFYCFFMEPLAEIEKIDNFLNRNGIFNY